MQKDNQNFMNKTKLEIDPYRFRGISITYEARGVIVMLMAMACEPELYGIVQSEGIPLTTMELFLNLPGDKESVERGLKELIQRKIVVYSDGKIPYMIPFMVKANDISQKRRVAGKLGGNPVLLRKPEESRKIKDPEEGDFYLTKKGKKLRDPQLKAFNIFWRIFNYPKGKADAADAWLDLKVDNNLFQSIITGAKKEADRRPTLLDKGQTPIMAQGYLHSRRFEDKV